MCLLFETVRVQNGRILNLDFHEDRMRESQKALFGEESHLSLADAVGASTLGGGVFRCRIEYSRHIESVKCESYIKSRIKTLKCVNFEGDYTYKSSDRSALQEAFSRRGEADDVLLIRDDMVTDTTIANVAFLAQGRWFTPSKPLLKGTMRAKFLSIGLLCEADIYEADIFNFEAVAVLNALRGFEVLGSVKCAMQSF